MEHRFFLDVAARYLFRMAEPAQDGRGRSLRGLPEHGFLNDGPRHELLAETAADVWRSPAGAPSAR
jgi:hypothetical protein